MPSGRGWGWRNSSRQFAAYDTDPSTEPTAADAAQPSAAACPPLPDWRIWRSGGMLPTVGRAPPVARAKRHPGREAPGGGDARRGFLGSMSPRRPIGRQLRAYTTEGAPAMEKGTG
jgi:hypothetical protein